MTPNSPSELPVNVKFCIIFRLLVQAACVLHPLWRKEAQLAIVFIDFLVQAASEEVKLAIVLTNFFLLFSMPIAFNPIWGAQEAEILFVLIFWHNLKEYFFTKKLILGCFFCFYGQRLVTVTWTYPSPWSIFTLFLFSRKIYSRMLCFWSSLLVCAMGGAICKHSQPLLTHAFLTRWLACTTCGPVRKEAIFIFNCDPLIHRHGPLCAGGKSLDPPSRVSQPRFSQRGF